MAANQRPQSRIDQLIARIEADGQQYTRSSTKVTDDFNNRNAELLRMLNLALDVANDALDTLKQNTAGNQLALVQQRLQALENAYTGQDTQVREGYQRLISLVQSMQNNEQNGNAALQVRISDLQARLAEAIRAEDEVAAPVREDDPVTYVGGYSNKKKPKRGGYAYVGSPGKVKTKTRTRTRTKTRNRTRRSLAGKASSSKRSSKRSTRRKQKRSRRR